METKYFENLKNNLLLLIDYHNNKINGKEVNNDYKNVYDLFQISLLNGVIMTDSFYSANEHYNIVLLLIEGFLYSKLEHGLKVKSTFNVEERRENYIAVTEFTSIMFIDIYKKLDEIKDKKGSVNDEDIIGNALLILINEVNRFLEIGEENYKKYVRENYITESTNDEGET